MPATAVASNFVRPIDIDHDNLILLKDIPDHIPGSVKPGRSAIFRWNYEGLQISGSKVRAKLPFVKVAGCRYTSVETLRDFIRVINGQPLTPALSRTSRRKMADTANQLCAANGY
jgi:hypothetical protein